MCDVRCAQNHGGARSSRYFDTFRKRRRLPRVRSRRMAAVPAPVDTPVEVDRLEPFLGACRACHEPVLVAELEDGRDVALEPRELLAEHRCPLCRQIAAKNHRRTGRCLRCGGSGYLGESLPDFAVALDADGIARPRIAAQRRPGEALHRPHRCP